MRVFSTDWLFKQRHNSALKTISNSVLFSHLTISTQNKSSGNQSARIVELSKVAQGLQYPSFEMDLSVARLMT